MTGRSPMATLLIVLMITALFLTPCLPSYLMLPLVISSTAVYLLGRR